MLALEIRPRGPERTVLSSDKSIKFNCTSNEPTTWFWLNVSLCHMLFRCVSSVPTFFCFCFAQSFIKLTFLSKLWQSTNSTIKTNTTSLDGRFVNDLHMDEVSYKNVGYYYCVKNSSITKEMKEKTTEIGEKEQMLDDLFHQGIAARSYLFVKGMF